MRSWCSTRARWWRSARTPRCWRAAASTRTWWRGSWRRGRRLPRPESRKELGDGDRHGRERQWCDALLTAEGDRQAVTPSERRVRIGDRIPEDFEPIIGEVHDPVVGDARASVEA